MRFLWFGKKKSQSSAPVKVKEERTPEEVFSVSGFVIESNPEPATKNTELSHSTINSLILSVLSQASSPADIAGQEFFQARGAIVLPIDDNSFSAERGFSARVRDGEKNRTVLIGPAPVITRATTPLCNSLASAIAADNSLFVVAIDGIAYAAFGIGSELI